MKASLNLQLGSNRGIPCHIILHAGIIILMVVVMAVTQRLLLFLFLIKFQQCL